MSANDLIHLVKGNRYVVCGAKGVRITTRLMDATCPRCRHDGSPVARTRALAVDAAHAEAIGGGA